MTSPTPSTTPATGSPDNVDIATAAAAYRNDVRRRSDGAPWLMLNMITSIDGSIEIDGTSGALGGPADLAVFRALRGVCDVVLVGAGTAMAENYGAVTVHESEQSARTARGQFKPPRIAMVTRQLSPDPTARVFVDNPVQPLIYTIESAPEDRRRALGEVAEIVNVDGPDGEVDPGLVVADLANRGAATVLVEGGPSLNGSFAGLDLFDELCVTTSPMLAGGGSKMLNHTPANMTAPRFRLERALTADGLLFCRWLKAASSEG